MVTSVVVILMASACGSDGASNDAPNSSPTSVEVSETTMATTTLDTSLSTLEPLPSTKVPQGTYAITGFVVPFSIATVGDWQRRYERAEIMMLGRGASKGPDPETEFAVTSSLVGGDTPEDALASWCSTGDVAFNALPPTTLFGSPAIQVEGTASSDCIWTSIDTTDNLTIAEGKTVRLIAADVEGTIVVVVANGPSDSWPALSTEVEAMVASLTLAA